MFGFSGLELRLAFYGFLLAAIAGALIYERHSGEAEVHRQDKAAADRQHSQDVATNEGTINDLRADNARLRDLALQPVPVLRLCVPRSVVSTGHSSAGAQPSVAQETGNGTGGVPSGTAGIDIGPAVSDIRWAAEVISDYRDRTWEWAVRQAQPVH